MKNILVVAGFVFLAGFAIGCSKSAPGCDASETKETVFEIVKGEMRKKYGAGLSNEEAEAMFKQAGLDKMKLSLSAVRTMNFDEKTGRYECAADLEMTLPDGNGHKGPITYTSELADGGNNYYVAVSGL